MENPLYNHQLLYLSKITDIFWLLSHIFKYQVFGKHLVIKYLSRYSKIAAANIIETSTYIINTRCLLNLIYSFIFKAADLSKSFKYNVI